MGLLDDDSLSASNAEKLEADFLEAHDLYADAIYRHCLVRIRDQETARDITQETFTRTWVYLSKGKEVDHLRAFLYRVANNLIVDTARRRHTTSLDAMTENDGFEAVDESIRDPFDTPALKEALSILSDMDEAYRTIITMRFVDELGPKEIAKALRLSENVVSVRLHRGIAQLKARMSRNEGVVHKPPPAA